jgi:hypothetical protein
MISQRIVRKLASLGLVILGSGLEAASCYRDVLRNGNEPIAGMLGVLGLFSIGFGCFGYRSAGEPITEQRRVRLCLSFEHLSYSVALLMWWLTAQRYAFFVDTPFDRDILTVQKVLIALLACVAMLSVAFRLTLRKPGAHYPSLIPFPRSISARRALATGVIAMTAFNLVQAQDTIRLSDGLQVFITSRGFPFTAFETLQLSKTPTAVEASGKEQTTLTAPDGTLVRLADDTITVLRFPGLPRQLSKGVRSAELSDGTRVQFGERAIVVSSTGKMPVVLNPRAQTAEFLGGTTRAVNTAHILMDALVAVFLATHLAICAERTTPQTVAGVGPNN